MSENQYSYDIVILGAGFGGLGMAAQLKRRGIENFIILERADAIGGVWRDNSYPGAACDTESHLYCYGFHPHLTVSRMYAGRNELLAYMESIVEQFDLSRHIRFNAEVLQAKWDEEDNRWNFDVSGGQHVTSRFFVPAWGQLNKPFIPSFKGLDTFDGVYFHSAAWRSDVDLSGKKVASIGAAASAVQYVPEIAPIVGKLSVFQRSANWIMPRNQVVFSKEQLQAFEREPELYEASRRKLHAFREAGFERTRHGTQAQQEGIKMASAHLAAQVPDPELRVKLTPNYEFACKRILRSDDYYPALMRTNVALVTEAIREFVPKGLVTVDGMTHAFDVVIFGTGFESQAFQGDLDVIGREGAHLRDRWATGAEAYLGMTVPGFPNMFMVYGPNTNLNHNSIITMLEIQQDYIIQAVQALQTNASKAIDVRSPVFNTFNRQLQEAMKASAFSSNCSSWYKNAEGKVINNWSGTVDEYHAKAARWQGEDFEWLDVAERSV